MFLSFQDEIAMSVEKKESLYLKKIAFFGIQAALESHYVYFLNKVMLIISEQILNQTTHFKECLL